MRGVNSRLAFTIDANVAMGVATGSIGWVIRIAVLLTGVAATVSANWVPEHNQRKRIHAP